MKVHRIYRFKYQQPILWKIKIADFKAAGMAWRQK